MLVALFAGLHAPATRAQTVDVIEYFNASQDHYFIASLPVEISALDAGQFMGWTRTGLSFRAYPQTLGNASPVCRFYIPPGYGDSHFYSASPAECAIAQAKYPFFVEESPNVMYIDLPDTTTGACPSGDIPVYRMWDARADTNHRYTTDPAIRAAMVARGWIAEGYGPDQVIMCAPTAGAQASTAQIVFMAAGAQAVPGSGDPGAWELVVMNLDGSGRTQLTHNQEQEFLPHFSPDGTRLLYSRYTRGGYGVEGSQSRVTVYDFATESTRDLTDTVNDAYPGVWSPDGTRIAFLSTRDYAPGRGGPALWVMNADGSDAHQIGHPSGDNRDQLWGDIAWSSQDWILFVVGENNASNTCFKARMDKIRPDGTQRTQVTDGGPNCTPPGMEQNGEADPGFSADGSTIYTSRGFPSSPPGLPGATMRKLYAVSSDAWYPGKPERDLSLASAPDCVEGVPKGSPDGTRILLFRACAGERFGVTVTDTAGSYRTWIAHGFGPDWNPVAKP